MFETVAMEESNWLSCEFALFTSSTLIEEKDGLLTGQRGK